MSVDNYHELLAHVGHDIKCVIYGEPGDPQNVAIECETCSTVLIDYNRPHRFVIVAKTPDNPIHDRISLIPVALPEDDLADGPASALLRYSAVAQAIHKERWQIVIDSANNPIFFAEEFAAFEALWVLANNPQAYDDIMTIVTRLAAHLNKLDDEQLTIMEDGGSFVAEQLGHLQDAVKEIEI